MKRDIINKLLTWSKNKTRIPLIIKGARQVGKSWAVREFGKHFPHFIEINFEKTAKLKQAFQGDINISQLVEKISVYTGKKIEPGKTLLFFDEIQECLEAISYLRYFKEELPQLHVIAAGSLIEFALEKVGMPVGRVEFLYLTPLSFSEFVSASGRDDLRPLMLNQNKNPIVATVLQDLLHTYMWLGGMPEVVQTWLHDQDVQACQAIQDRLITAYQDDFPKYAKKYQVQYVDKIFNHILLQFSKKFIFTHVDADIKANTLKNALFLLEKAGIAHICYYTSGQKPPLAANINEKFFKVFFLDIGLAQRLLRLNYQDWIIAPLKVANLGEISEQFVAQELIAYQSHQRKELLFYWHRESKNSKAEIDFVI